MKYYILCIVSVFVLFGCKTDQLFHDYPPFERIKWYENPKNIVTKHGIRYHFTDTIDYIIDSFLVANKAQSAVINLYSNDFLKIYKIEIVWMQQKKTKHNIKSGRYFLANGIRFPIALVTDCNFAFLPLSGQTGIRFSIEFKEVGNKTEFIEYHVR